MGPSYHRKREDFRLLFNVTWLLLKITRLLFKITRLHFKMSRLLFKMTGLLFKWTSDFLKWWVTFNNDSVTGKNDELLFSLSEFSTVLQFSFITLDGGVYYKSWERTQRADGVTGRVHQQIHEIFHYFPWICWWSYWKSASTNSVTPSALCVRSQLL